MIFVVGAVILPVGAVTLPGVGYMPGPTITMGGSHSPDLSGNGVNRLDEKLYRPTDEIKVIVRMEGKSLSAAAMEANMSVPDYALSETGRAHAEALLAEQNALIASLGSKVKNIGYHYTTLFSGFSCTVQYGDLEGISGLRAVKSAMIAERYNVASTEATDNALNAYETGIYNSSGTGYTGKGMVVAVLDTGTDYTHSAFQRRPDGNLTLTADRIQAIFSLLGAAKLDENARWESVYRSGKMPFSFDYADHDTDVYPVNDHGTHVAGIITGKDDTITGVAIDAQLVTMKVFGNKDQGAEQEDILAALSDAVLLGVDVINMSLGSSCGFSRAADDDNTNEIYDAVRAAGINLIVAASNSYSSAKGSEKGDTNLVSNPDSATIGSPATYPSSMAVASVTGAKTHYLFVNGEQPIYLTKARRNNGDEIEFYDLILAGRKSATVEYVVVPGIGNDGNYETVDVTGKIAIIKRGVTTFEEKVETAKNHGAIGAIIYNNVSGNISMTIGISTLPSCSISMDAGEYFKEHTSGTLVLDAGNLAGPFMSEFSSWGPNADLELSPDLTSYGGDINSAVRGGYDILSGTSMACPNLAGSAVLVRAALKEQHPDLTARELSTYVNRLLMSTASVLRNEAGNPYSPRKQGAGLADAERAIKTPAYLMVEGSDKAKLSLGDDPARTGVYTLTFHLVNRSGSALSYRLSVLTMTEAVSTDGKTVAEQAYMLSPSVSYTVENGTLRGNMVTVSGYGDATVTATVTLSESDRAYLTGNFKNGMYVEGFVQFDCADGDIDLTIPYLAFFGDWTEAPLLDVTAFEVGKEQKDSSILEDEKLKPDAFATIPMAGYYTGSGRTEDDLSYYYMGKIGYILADGYEQPAVLEKYCSLTSSENGNFKLYYIAAGLLRNAKTVHMTITDTVTGEVIFEKDTQNSRKSYYNGAQTGGLVEVDFDASKAGLANNRKYDFEMTCALDWAGEQHNKNNTFRFSFYMDDESPVICREQNTLRVKTDKQGNITDYLLDMYIYDNQYVQGYFLYTYDELDENGNPVNPEQLINGIIPVDDFEGGKVNKITHDLTSLWYKMKGGKNEGSKNIGIRVVDYAKNMTDLYYTLEMTDATSVAFKSGRSTTANGDTISFRMTPYKQRNLMENLETLPKDVYTADLVWKSSDESVAIVREGIVTTLKAGNATITATSATGAAASVEIICTGTATGTDIPLSGLRLNETSVWLERGETLDLYAELVPYNLTETPTLTWRTVSSYVTITPDPDNPLHCTVYAKESGRANVTVSASGKLFSATCRVQVAEEFEIESIYLKSYTGRGDENGVVEIPAEKGITTIYRLAFLNNKYVTKVIIPEGVEEIQYAAFYGCENLKEIVLPSTCKKVDEWAFGHMESLETINTGSVNTIARLAFYGDKSLRAVDLSNCYTICENAFSFCTSLTEVDVSRVGQLGEYAFNGCSSLTTLMTSPGNNIPNYCFAYCTSLQKLELSGTSVGRQAFLGCSRLNSVVLRGDMTEIGYGAFNGCTSLTNLVFEGSVKYIGDYAFGSCVSLPTIYIPAGCVSIGDYAFGGCTGVESITFSAEAKVDEIGLSPFYGTTGVSAFAIEPGSKYLTVQSGILYTRDMEKLVMVPNGSMISGYTLPETVREVGVNAFSGALGLQSVNLNRTEIIGNGAFSSSSVRSVTAGTSLREIGDRAFYGCSYFSSFDLPASVRVIGESAFAGCARLAWGTLTLPEGLEKLGGSAFISNYGIETLVLPGTLTEIPEGAFAYCKRLTDIRMGDGLTAIGKYAFRGCDTLSDLRLPDSVTTLGEGCFAECVGIEEVTLPASLTEIPAYAFYGATALKSLGIPASVEKAGNYAFFGATSLADVNLSGIHTVGTYAFVRSGLVNLRADHLAEIGDFAFYGIAAERLSLPEVKTIGRYAFADTTALAAVSLPKVEVIGEGAFFRNTAITGLSLPACREIGAYAFARASSFAEISFPALEKLGTEAFYGTRVSALHFPASLVELAPGALLTKPYNSEDENIARIAEVTVDSACERFFADEVGAVYRRFRKPLEGGTVDENGNPEMATYYELVAYASGIRGESYTVLEGTLRIEEGAFATNPYLKKVVVARTVTNLGSSAFYGCTGLTEISFLSVEAPIIESRQSDASPDGWTYNNFITLIPGEGEKPVELTVIVPKNGVRYDSHMWQRYVGSVTYSDEISMTNSTEYLIRMIDRLPETVTLKDAETVRYLLRVYNATDEGQKTFITNSDKLLRAAEIIANLEKGMSQTNLEISAGEYGMSPAEEPAEPTVAPILVLVPVGLVALALLVAVILKKKKGGEHHA